MRGRLRAMAVAGLGMGFLSAVPGGAAGAVDDDLAVVRKAVQAGATEATPTAASAPAGPSADPAPLRARPARGSGRWLKVRIVEGSGKRSRITVNVPLAVARALGEDLPVELGDQKIRLSDVLNQLEAGEALVEVKKGDANVRVWIE